YAKTWLSILAADPREPVRFRPDAARVMARIAWIRGAGVGRHALRALSLTVSARPCSSPLRDAQDSCGPEPARPNRRLARYGAVLPHPIARFGADLSECDEFRTAAARQGQSP